MPYNGFPLFGEYSHQSTANSGPSNDDDDDVPDLRSAVRAWTLAALVVGSLFLALILLVPGSEQKSGEFERQLPSGYGSVVSALVRATGNDCARICSVDRKYSDAPGAALIVACSRSQEAGSCTTPARYEIRVSNSAIPTR